MQDTARIRELNDLFRTGQDLSLGKGVLTAGIVARGEAFARKAFAAVREFDSFTADNDPYGEHDFGAVTVDGAKVFWKIDYYDRAMEAGSEAPADPSKTLRVLTIMLAEEY